MSSEKTSNFWPRWRHRWIHCASFNNQKKDNNRFKNKKQTELTENQTAWKSDDQELKKKHSSRPVRGVEMGSRVGRIHNKVAAGGLGQVRQNLVEWAVPHSCTDKLGGTTGERVSLSNPGLQCREIDPQSL